MGNHLRFPAGAAREVHQHGVVVAVHEGGTLELRSLFPLALPVVEAFRYGLPVIGDGDVLLHRGTLFHSGLYLTDHVGVIDTDDGLDRGASVAVDDVFLSQHVGGGDDDGPYLVQGQHDHPPLVAAFQYEHHWVVLADAQRLQIGGSLVGLLSQLAEGGTYLLALIVSPQQGQTIGAFVSPHVHDVVGEVEVLRDDELQVLIVILNRRKLCLL